MTEDSIRLTAGRPSGSGTAGGGSPATSGRKGLALPVPSELIVLALVAALVLLAAAIAENFEAPVAWGFVTLLGVAYILSRGLVKRGHGDDGL